MKRFSKKEKASIDRVMMKGFSLLSLIELRDICIKEINKIHEKKG